VSNVFVVFLHKNILKKENIFTLLFF